MANSNSRRLKTVAAFCAALAVGALPQSGLAQDSAVAEIVNASGEAVGVAHLEQAPSGVIVNVELEGLPPGWHGIHLHGTGSCAPDFKAAKGHVNPQAKQHGLRNPAGPDNGDLPNIHVAANGKAAAQFHTTRVSIREGGGAPALLDDDGTAVVIHAEADDHLTQPIGGAGGRIGCGVVAEVSDS